MEDDITTDYPQYLNDVEVVRDEKKKHLNGGKPTLASLGTAMEYDYLDRRLKDSLKLSNYYGMY